MNDDNDDGDFYSNQLVERIVELAEQLDDVKMVRRKLKMTSNTRAHIGVLVEQAIKQSKKPHAKHLFYKGLIFFTSGGFIITQNGAYNPEPTGGISLQQLGF